MAARIVAGTGFDEVLSSERELRGSERRENVQARVEAVVIAALLKTLLGSMPVRGGGKGARGSAEIVWQACRESLPWR